MPIRALISDLYGVILRRGGPGTLDRLADEFGRPKVELSALVRSAEQPSLTGRATRQEGDQAAHAGLASHLGISQERLVEVRAAWQLPARFFDQELLAFIRGLRPRLRTALLSDAWLDTRELIKPYVNEDTFDAIVISAEEGVVKPDPEIYRRTLERLGVTPEEAIFVDDWPPNVEGARSLGIHGIVFESAQQMMNDVLPLLEETE